MSARAIVSLPGSTSERLGFALPAPRELSYNEPAPTVRRIAIRWPTSRVLVCPPGLVAVPPAPATVKFSAILAAAGRSKPISDWVRGSLAAIPALGPEPPSSVCEAIARRAGADGNDRPLLRFEPGAPARISVGSSAESPAIDGWALPRPSIAPRRAGRSVDPIP